MGTGVGHGNNVGAPAVTHKKGNGPKQLLLHRPTAQLWVGLRHKSLPFPPTPQWGCNPKLWLSLAPITGRSRRGAGKGQPHFSLSAPKHRKGLAEEIPALSLHVPGYFPAANRGRRVRQTLTFVQQQLLQGVAPLESFLGSGPAGEGQCVGKEKLRKWRLLPATTQHEQKNHFQPIKHSCVSQLPQRHQHRRSTRGQSQAWHRAAPRWLRCKKNSAFRSAGRKSTIQRSVQAAVPLGASRTEKSPDKAQGAAGSWGFQLPRSNSQISHQVREQGELVSGCWSISRAKRFFKPCSSQLKFHVEALGESSRKGNFQPEPLLRHLPGTDHPPASGGIFSR